MLRVLVAEDSATARRLLVSLLQGDAEIEVVGEACDGAEAVELCRKLRPDLVTMDIDMPVMDGVEATRQIMVEGATPVVMVSSISPSDVRHSMLAIGAGALAVLAKPSAPGTAKFERESRELIATIKAMAEVKLVRRWPTIPPYRVSGQHPTVRLGTAELAVVGLVASTGGPNALRTILAALPPTFEPPILIVQHIASGFAQGLADWLSSTTHHEVKLAVHHEPLVPGMICIAPDDRHLEATRDRMIVSDSPPVEGFRPSGSRLLSSLAVAFGREAVGVILTGMGQDGVAGLRDMRDAGAVVIAQDEASCDIYGMPAVAVSTGVVTTTTPLAEIPARLIQLATAG